MVGDFFTHVWVSHHLLWCRIHFPSLCLVQQTNWLYLVKQSKLPGRASKLLWVMLTSGGQVTVWGVTRSEFRVLSRKGTTRLMTGRTKLFSGMSRGKTQILGTFQMEAWAEGFTHLPFRHWGWRAAEQSVLKICSWCLRFCHVSLHDFYTIEPSRAWAELLFDF